MTKFIFLSLFFLIIFPLKCFAHVSERALILLLPTEFYIPAGISVLILTILIAYLTPISFITSIFKPLKFKILIFLNAITEKNIKK